MGLGQENMKLVNIPTYTGIQLAGGPQRCSYTTWLYHIIILLKIRHDRKSRGCTCRRMPRMDSHGRSTDGCRQRCQDLSLVPVSTLLNARGHTHMVAGGQRDRHDSVELRESRGHSTKNVRDRDGR